MKKITISDYDLRDAFKLEKKLLSFCGFYPRRTSKNQFIYIFSTCAHLFFSFGLLISMFTEMIIERRNLSKVSETLLFLMTHFTFMCKLSNFEYYSKNLLDMEDLLTRDIYYGFTQDQLKMVERRVETCKMAAKVFRGICIIAALLYGLFPLIDASKSDSLPLPGWFPCKDRFYSVKFTFQMISVAITANTNSTMDILSWMLITIASAEFDILQDNLKNTDYRSNGNPKRVEKYFKNCVKHHRAIVRFVYKIEDTFSQSIFLQFFCSIIVFCVTSFMMLIVPIQSVQFFFLFFYLLCMMWQVGIYCWYGHDIMTTSEAMAYNFYMSNWYESDMSMRKNLTIFLERTKKPVTLTAGKFITLSLTTFTTILRSSYSYLAVLQRLYNNT